MHDKQTETRTSVVIPKELHRRARIVSACTGILMQTMLAEALQATVERLEASIRAVEAKNILRRAEERV